MVVSGRGCVVDGGFQRQFFAPFFRRTSIFIGANPVDAPVDFSM